METDIIKPIGGPEPTVTFRLESDRDLYEVRNPEIDEALIQITGYDVQFRFNNQYLKTIEDIEAAATGLKNLFRDMIIEQRLGISKQNDPE